MKEKKIRVTKIFDFEMAHALYNHDGECKNVHGHSYKLYVTVLGEVMGEIENPKNGMVIDFSSLKQIIVDGLIKHLDHTMIIDINSPHKKLGDFLEENNFKVLKVSYPTTCENMVYDFSQRIKHILPENLSLFSLRLYETKTSYAEWHEQDNL